MPQRGATNDYQMIISFATPVTVGSTAATSGTGSVSGSQVTVKLTGVTNVQRSDIAQTKAQSGMAACPHNFREDVNGDGAINASDVALVKFNNGNSLPTPP